MEHRFRKPDQNHKSMNQRRFAPLWGEPALFFRAPLPSMKNRKAGATYAEDLCAGRQCPPPGPLRSGVLRDNNIVLPLAVLEELDGLKNAEGKRDAVPGR